MTNWQDLINAIGPTRLRETKNAKLYIEIERIDELINIVKQARSRQVPAYIIGSGLYPLNNDNYINGLLIKNNCRRFEIFDMSGNIRDGAGRKNHKLVYSQSGTLISQLVRFTIEEGLEGLEYYLGMPGSLGGAIYTNTVYRPQNMYINDTVSSIKILNSDNQIIDVDQNYFASRAVQVFSEAKDIVLSVTFRLLPGDKNILWERANNAVKYRLKNNGEI